MPFNFVSGERIRNLDPYKIEPSPYINIISGPNGAGKTNLLEAIYLNGLGKSFRTNKVRNIIREGEQECLVFSEFNPDGINAQLHKIGVQRKRGGTQRIRVDGEDLGSTAALAKTVPMLAVQPSELELIDGGAGIRRKYLDWLLFHVEQSFFSVWRDSQKLLKQRNSLLRKKAHQLNNIKPDYHSSENMVWEKQYLDISERLNKLRMHYSEVMAEMTNAFIKDYFFTEESLQLSFKYKRGWDEETSLKHVLEDTYYQDLRKGFTQYGPHRSDLDIRVNGYPAKEYLSRGQKKLVSMAMRMVQIKYLSDKTNRRPVILIDDLASELDEENVQRFCKLLEELKAQVFLTTLENDRQLESNFSNKNKDALRVFHVKQGVIKSAV